MRLRSFYPLILVLLNVALIAQKDSTVNDEKFRITEGIYLSYSDFRRNDPVTREQIESSVDKEHLDFFGKTLNEGKFSILRHGEKSTVDAKSVWGFYQNNTLHVRYDKDFFRVPVFGAICYLMGTVEVVSPGFYYGYGGMMSTTGTSVRSKEVRNFLINFYDGVIIPFSMDDAEKLISRDKDIYSEFRSLRSRQRKEQISRYIRKYNEAHPVYFLKQ